jgi:hypothetical protein
MVQIKALRFVAQNGDDISAGQRVLPRSAISQVSTPAAIDANAPFPSQFTIPNKEMEAVN